MAKEQGSRQRVQTNSSGEAIFYLAEKGDFNSAVFCEGVNSKYNLKIYLEKTERGYDVRLAILDRIGGCAKTLDVVVDCEAESLEVKK